MDPLIAKVLAGLDRDLQGAVRAGQGHAQGLRPAVPGVSTGKVLTSAISDIDDSDAVVFVAADSQVTNKSTKGKAQPRYYRLKLTMVRKGDTWLTSNLQFVG